MWDEIIYPFPSTIKFWEWISNFIPHFAVCMITYPWLDLSWSMLVEGATGSHCWGCYPWFSNLSQVTVIHLKIDWTPVYLQMGYNDFTTFYSSGYCNDCWTSCSVHLRRLTHWGQDEMAAIFQTRFSNAFSWMKMQEFWLRFHWCLFLKIQLTIFQHWFR